MIAAALAIAPLLASCGFRPMYGEHSGSAAPVAVDLSSIEVASIPNSSGQRLRNELTRLLNPAALDTSHRYVLSVKLGEIVDTFALERTGFATRGNYEVVANYTLTDTTTTAPVLVGNTRGVSGFNILDNDFSTYVAQGDARTGAIQQVAYQIRNRLASYFATGGVAAPAAAPAAPEAGTPPSSEPRAPPALPAGPGSPGGV